MHINIYRHSGPLSSSRIKSSVSVYADFLWADKFVVQSGIKKKKKAVLLDARRNKTFKYSILV